MYKSTYKSTKVGFLFSAAPSFSEAALSMPNKLKWTYRQYLPDFIRRSAYVTLLLAGGIGVASSSPLQVPNSEVDYKGASTTKAFVATEPYVVNIQGTSTTISLSGASRSHDFSGTVPFVNPTTGKNDPSIFQAYSSGLINWYGSQITNKGVPGRIDKTTFGSDAVTLIRYNAGDDIAFEKCRTKLGTFPVPPRTHVRWELEVAFGKADGVNDWDLTPSTHWGSNGTIDNGAVPVSFWGLTSHSQSNGPFSLMVDTDNLDPTKLMIQIVQRVGTATSLTEIKRVHGIPRHTLIPIVIEAFLDERANADGGKGIVQVWVNNALVLEKQGPTIALGTQPHYWSMDTYLWNDPKPSAYTRATFWKTAKLMVFPANATTASTTTSTPADTTAPSVPANLTATAPNPTTVNLSWSASTDNVGVVGYRIYKNGTQVGTSTVTNFSDTSVAGGTSYNYTVKAYDAAGNLSTSSNTATIQTPTATSSFSISSYFVNNINLYDATVNWTTNVPSNAVVYYGRSTSLDSSASYSTLSTGHALKLINLWPGYTYYYKIVAKNSSGATYTSPVSTFKTRY